MSDTNSFNQPIGPALPDFVAPPRLTPTTIEGTHASLVPIEVEEHSLPLYEVLGTPEHEAMWTYMMKAPAPFTPNGFDGYLRDKLDNPDYENFTILHTESGAPAGMCAFIRHRPEHGSVEIGHVIVAPAYRRTPLLTNAIYLMLKHAFDAGYRRVEWKCDAINERSMAAALRLGFTYEGIFRNDVVYKGRSRDTAWFSIANEQWPDIDSGYRAWFERVAASGSGRVRMKLLECITRQRGQRAEPEQYTLPDAYPFMSRMTYPHPLGVLIGDQLRRAARRGDGELLRGLLSHYPGIARIDEITSGVIGAAVSEKKYECAMLLFRAGASIDACDINGLSSLHWAVANNDLEAATWLLEQGANPNVRTTFPKGDAPLSLAEPQQKQAMIDLLVAWGARREPVGG